MVVSRRGCPAARPAARRRRGGRRRARRCRRVPEARSGESVALGPGGGIQAEAAARHRLGGFTGSPAPAPTPRRGHRRPPGGGRSPGDPQGRECGAVTTRASPASRRASAARRSRCGLPWLRWWASSTTSIDSPPARRRAATRPRLRGHAARPGRGRGRGSPHEVIDEPSTGAAGRSQQVAHRPVEAVIELDGVDTEHRRQRRELSHVEVTEHGSQPGHGPCPLAQREDPLEQGDPP